MLTRIQSPVGSCVLFDRMVACSIAIPWKLGRNMNMVFVSLETWKIDKDWILRMFPMTLRVNSRSLQSESVQTLRLCSVSRRFMHTLTLPNVFSRIACRTPKALGESMERWWREFGLGCCLPIIFFLKCPLRIETFIYPSFSMRFLWKEILNCFIFWRIGFARRLALRCITFNPLTRFSKL